MTVNEFITELQNLSEQRRELPIVIDAPNKMELCPTLRARWDSPLDVLVSYPNKIVITWE